MTLAVANLVLAAYMTGVIWVVQIVHYPLFAAVGEASWPAYEAAHRRRITVVVGLPMLTQPLVATLLLLEEPSVLAGVNLALTAGLLVATVAVFGRLHDGMSASLTPGAHARLIRLNAVRTGAWTVQAAIAAALLWR